MDGIEGDDLLSINPMADLTDFEAAWDSVSLGMPGEKPSQVGKESSNRVIFKNNDMQAYLILYRPIDGSEYTKQDIADILAKNGVTAGINESRFAAMIKKHIYGQEVLVAEGDPPVDGKDGYIEYRNDLDIKHKKPVIRADGSVDYTSVNIIRCVNSGDQIAEYHPAVEGVAGFNVKGRLLKPKRAREMKPMHTIGCTYDEETRIYTATMDGKLEINKGRLTVQNFQEFKQDIDIVFGNVDFKGDVMIHGSVKPGVTISATKSITIDGVLEGSNVNAGTDLIVKGGILGGESSKINCGGDLFADFVEYADINVEGSASANIFMDCRVFARGFVNATGKLGAIVGGDIYGMKGVDAVFTGNDVFLRTAISVGAKEKLQKTVLLFQQQIKSIETLREKIEAELETINRDMQLGTADSIEEKKKEKLMQSSIDQGVKLRDLKQRLEILKRSIEEAKGAKIHVADTAYEGCVMMVDEKQLYLDSNKRQVEFIKDPRGDLVCRPVRNW
ncbi:MAG: DUF342 domain-containing protein [Lachnospiraceae bacterium]|nr:DUF342 domain-containing protein [Lachnospiraceae bacterium]